MSKLSICAIIPSNRKYLYLSSTWAIFISALTIFRFSPDTLNADTIMHSIISLQNLTLYYWGQNRLLNILPLIVLPVQNPSANLAAVLFISSLTFFLLLLLVSRIAVFTLNISNSNASVLSLKVFILISSFFIFTFTPHAISEIAINHIEYSFPALLLCCAFFLSIVMRKKSVLSAIASIMAIILAVGMNPSTVIPAVFISLASIFYRKRLGVPELTLGTSSIIAFAVWNFISKQHGNLPYNSFDPLILLTGLERVLAGLIGILNLKVLLILIALFALVKVFLLINKKLGDEDFRGLLPYISYSTLIFSVGWLLLFSSSRWVEMNQFEWRYFIYVIFAVLFFLAIFFAKILDKINRKVSSYVAIIAALLVVSVTYPHIFSFNKYTVFQWVNALTAPGSSLYTGNYWVVWPSVLRDMMEGHEAYGLTYRGEANRETARKHILEKIKKNGHASVFCLNENTDNCISLINSVAGPFYVNKTTFLSDGVHEINISDYAPSLSFNIDSLYKLPSEVGLIEDKFRKSNGKSGFLIFGPYAPLKTGIYRLNVYGSYKAVNGSYVDIVSDKGNKIHARFALKNDADDVLIQDEVVHLTNNVSDIEVRVWVNQSDTLQLSGYSLEPFSDTTDK